MKKQPPCEPVPGLTLDAYLAGEPRGALTRLAEQLSLHNTYLCDIRKGRRVPPLDLAFAIQDATGVPARSYLQAA